MIYSHIYSIRITAASAASTQLIHNGILFYRHYQRGDTVYWRCCRSNADLRCRARLTSRARAGTITEINRHNHEAAINGVE